MGLSVAERKLDEFQRRINELETRINELETAIHTFLNAEGHDLCHENRQALAEVLGDAGLCQKYPKCPNRDEFEAGCKAYADQIFGPGGMGRDQNRQWTSLRATVHSFDPKYALASLTFANGTTMKLSSTSFVSDRPTRFPRVGEVVEVLFADDRTMPIRFRPYQAPAKDRPKYEAMVEANKQAAAIVLSRHTSPTTTLDGTEPADGSGHGEDV